MNLAKLHQSDKAIATNKLFQAEEGSVIALQILKNEQLKEHITKTPALLVCVTGNVVFENENGIKESLISGDFITIEPNVKHWVNALENSQLILIK